MANELRQTVAGQSETTLATNIMNGADFNQDVLQKFKVYKIELDTKIAREREEAAKREIERQEREMMSDEDIPLQKAENHHQSSHASTLDEMTYNPTESYQQRHARGPSRDSGMTSEFAYGDTLTYDDQSLQVSARKDQPASGQQSLRGTSHRQLSNASSQSLYSAKKNSTQKQPIQHESGSVTIEKGYQVLFSGEKSVALPSTIGKHLIVPGVTVKE